MLTLPIKSEWFNMILIGEKKDEYREIKPYYKARLENLFVFQDSEYREKIVFRNGYAATSPQFTAICSMRIGEGKSEWGAEPGKEYYVLTIHEIIRKGETHE